MITASLVIYHNSQNEIDTLLDSVLRSPIDRLYIVDNSCHDLYRALERRSERICYIHNANNGYGAAHNIAMREAITLGAKYHVVINPDIYFTDGTIQTLTEYMDSHEQVGWVMPRVVYPDGEMQHLCKLLPSPCDLIARRFIPKRFLGKSREKFNPKITDCEVCMPYLSGCFMFLRVSALQQVGLFDERFFMYGEDLDLSRRMYQKYKTVYYPSATVVHAHRAESYHSLKMLKIHIKNIAMYFNKWGWFFDPERRKINKEIRAEIARKLLPLLLFASSTTAQNITNQQVSDYINRAAAEHRIESLDSLDTAPSRLRQNPEQSLETMPKRADAQIFGREIFGSQNLTFIPNQNIATPVHYKLGAGDEVIIDIWGANQTSIRRKISPDGHITIDGLGLVYLNGLTIAEAERQLKRRLSTLYSGIDKQSGDSQLKLTLGQIRTIDIHVMGEVVNPGSYSLSSLATAFYALYRAGGVGDLGSLRNIRVVRDSRQIATIDIHVMGEVVNPGSYSLSSLATAFYALYRAGGVGDLGSLRNIRVVRDGRQIATIDIYNFIMNADASDNIHLQQGDMIVVPPYTTLVEVRGRVKRPLFYELQEGQTLSSLLDYAGGFMDDAYRKSITVTRKNGREYQIYTVYSADFDTFVMTDGDIVDVAAIDDRFENRLKVKGAIFRPGVYQLNESCNTVKKLIAKADGVTGDALLKRALLHREREDLTHQTIQIDLEKLLNGTAPDIVLQRNDILYIPSIHSLKEQETIEIFGAIAHPGALPYAENSTLEDIIIQAGGLLPSASTARIDISRPIIDSRSTKASELLCEQFTFSINEDFTIDSLNSFTLKPYDRIYIRNSPSYHPPQSVTIDGEVLYSGEYPITKRSERLSDLVAKAGGVTAFAYTKGARLVRKMSDEEHSRKQSALLLAARSAKDSIDVQSLNAPDHFNIGIDLERALANPGSNADLVLKTGDSLVIPQYDNTVHISGCVMSPNSVSYTDHKRVKYYIEQAGGFAQDARKKHCYIVYMNGQIRRGRLNNNKIVEPGCQIIVPTKEHNGDALQSILSVATTSASLATMIATIGNILK